ncbi:M12 family metallo-peptidase [Gynuella sp.]|uniref:M12 family metallo-peptidase n=1 Tax=Gynuella sp. TaxID=2969146 RepID=UPI003D13B873
MLNINKIVVISGLLLLSRMACATEMGVQFYVDFNVAGTASEQKIFRETLSIWVSQLADYYQDSNINLQPEIVSISFGDYSKGETDAQKLLDRIGRREGDFSGLFKRAHEFGADYTIAIFPTLRDGDKALCGRAEGVHHSIGQIASLYNSYAVMSNQAACRASTLAHEIGHLQGLVHGDYVAKAFKDSSHTNGRLNNDNRAKGWGEGNRDGVLQANEFGTIMVGNYQYDIEGRVRLAPVFSSPNVSHVNCGSDKKCGDKANGDAAAVLNKNIEFYTSHATPDVDMLSYASANLASCIKNSYPTSELSDKILSYKDIDKVHNIDCPSRDIDSVAGLEKITGLANSSSAYINLSNNKIVSLLPLMNVNKSARINLSGNVVASCHQLDLLMSEHTNVVRPSRCLNIAALMIASSYAMH